MARRIAIPHDKMALRIVGPYDEYLAARIQRLDMPTNMPTTNIQELGNPHLAGVTTDIPEVTATFQAMDVSTKVFATLTGNDPNGVYPVNGVDITDLGEVDLIGVVKDKGIADYVKSIHIQRGQVTGFTFTYSVDGESTEEYTVSGNEKRWFRHDIVVEAFSAAASPVTLTYDPLVMKNGNYCLSVILDGDYLEEVAVAPGDDEYLYTPGVQQVSFSPLGTRIVVVYHFDTGLNSWTDVSDSTIPAAIRGKNVPVRITASGVTTAIDRVQSVTIRGTFPNTVVKEMGNLSVVGTTVQVPEVTGDISVLDTDLELIALFATGDIANTDVEYRACEFTPSGISLEVQLQDPVDGCGGSLTVLKAVYIPQLTLTSEGHTTNVGGNATQTFAWKSTTGECVVYSGAYTGTLPT